MDWIHCNKCLKQLDSGIILHLTSCGHMFCNSCLENGSKDNTCVLCCAPCSVIKLAPDMKQEVQDYFTDPEEIMTKACEVLRFQKQHRRRLLSYVMQSAKKFYAARSEVRRMSELCQKQQSQIKEYRATIKELESQLANQSKQASPFTIPTSPGNNLSPSFIQCTPACKRPAKSTPYLQTYQSTLVTPTRISKQRGTSSSAHSQRSNTSNKISSTMFTPPTPESVGLFLSQRSNESGYASSQKGVSPGIVYCNGYEVQCPFKKNKLWT